MGPDLSGRLIHATTRKKRLFATVGWQLPLEEDNPTRSPYSTNPPLKQRGCRRIVGGEDVAWGEDLHIIRPLPETETNINPAELT